MSGTLYAKRKWTSYENFVAECPYCGAVNVYNRASDLKDLEPIAFRTVACLSTACGRPFNINGDSVDSKHECFLHDCHELLDQKHYMNCILTIAQAYELFFHLFLRVELLYKPFASDPDRDYDHLNELAGRLFKKTKNCGFVELRALFTRQLVCGRTPRNLPEAEATIGTICCSDMRPMSRSKIKSIQDSQLASLLGRLDKVTINRTRNDVVHKQAYRPTRDEAESALEEARSIILALTGRLGGLYDDINWYMSLAKQGSL